MYIAQDIASWATWAKREQKATTTRVCVWLWEETSQRVHTDSTQDAVRVHFTRERRREALDKQKHARMLHTTDVTPCACERGVWSIRQRFNVCPRKAMINYCKEGKSNDRSFSLEGKRKKGRRDFYTRRAFHVRRGINVSTRAKGNGFEDPTYHVTLAGAGGILPLEGGRTPRGKRPPPRRPRNTSVPLT